MIVSSRARGTLLALLTALLLPVGLVATAGSANAHSRLVSSDPADGAQLDAPPSTVALTFNEPVVALGTEIVVTGPDGPVPVVDLAVDGATATATLETTGTAGEHTIAWRATSADGHPISGELGYSVAAAVPVTEPGAAEGPVAEPDAVEPGAAEPAAEEPAAETSAALESDPADAAEGSVPVVAWLVVAAVVLVAAAGIFTRMRRHRL